MDPVAAVGGAIDRIRREVVLARFLGKLAVEHGVRELTARVEEALAASSPPSRPRGEETHRPSAPVATRVDEPAATAPVAVVDADSLALADYDHLPAAHVIAALGALDDAERAAIEQYELAGRHRRTILAKLDQLRSVGT